jgi:hypothetical protein
VNPVSPEPRWSVTSSTRPSGGVFRLLSNSSALLVTDHPRCVEYQQRQPPLCGRNHRHTEPSIWTPIRFINASSRRQPPLCGISFHHSTSRVEPSALLVTDQPGQPAAAWSVSMWSVSMSASTHSTARCLDSYPVSGEKRRRQTRLAAKSRRRRRTPRPGVWREAGEPMG